MVSSEAFTSSVSQLGYNPRVALPGQNRIQNRESTQPHDITEYMVQLNVHLVQGFLHMQEVSGRQPDEVVPVPRSDRSTSVLSALAWQIQFDSRKPVKCPVSAARDVPVRAPSPVIHGIVPCSSKRDRRSLR
jgi:hypothetical protein